MALDRPDRMWNVVGLQTEQPAHLTRDLNQPRTLDREQQAPVAGVVELYQFGRLHRVHLQVGGRQQPWPRASPRGRADRGRGPPRRTSSSRLPVVDVRRSAPYGRVTVPDEMPRPAGRTVGRTPGKADPHTDRPDIIRSGSRPPARQRERLEQAARARRPPGASSRRAGRVSRPAATYGTNGAERRVPPRRACRSRRSAARSADGGPGRDEAGRRFASSWRIGRGNAGRASGLVA